MAEDSRPAAILAAEVDSFESIASRGRRIALRVSEFVAGVLENVAVELGGALRSFGASTFIVELPNALKAVQCAFRVRDATHASPVRLRMGVHLGDLWAVGNQALGEGVEVAVKLQSLAAPGALVLSREVYREVEGQLDAPARALGAVELRNLGRTVEAFEIPAGRVIGSRAADGGAAPQRAGAVTARLPAAIGGMFASLDLGARRRRARGRREVSEDAWEIEAEREAARTAAFRAQLAAFSAVGALLLVVWFVTTPFGHPWFLYPIGAWAIGIAHHYVAVRRRRSQSREMAALLTAEQRRTLRRLHRTESGFAQHLTAFVSVTAFLFMVNMITSSTFPWFVFPAAGWTVGLVSHHLFYRVRRRSLLERLRRLGLARGELAGVHGSSSSAGRFGPLVDEAHRIKESLVRQIQASEPLRSRFAAELVPLLDRYLGQIDVLNERSCELDGLLDTLSEEQIDSEVERLRSRREAARSASVRAEYDKTLEQHAQQRESLVDLRNQQEVLDLRIRGSVLALKRIEMDVARMKGLETSAVMTSLKEKSDDLSRYLEDLRAGYSELEA
jgi:class 3 adenylate cyclase